MNYLSEIFYKLKINYKSNIILTSNLLSLIKINNTKNLSLIGNQLLDELVEYFHNKGTVIIPSFNWDFCHGRKFEISRTSSQVGSLANLALKNNNFRRTHHAIYSFLVYGKLTNDLLNIKTKDAFSNKSIMSYLYNKKFKQIFLNLEIEDGFFLVHLAEQMVGVDYRYIKNFIGNYIDYEGHESEKTFSFYVRKNESLKWKIVNDGRSVSTAICNSFENRLNNIGAFKIYEKGAIKAKCVDVYKAVNLMKDSLNNNGCIVYPRKRID